MKSIITACLLLLASSVQPRSSSGGSRRTYHLRATRESMAHRVKK